MTIHSRRDETPVRHHHPPETALRGTSKRERILRAAIDVFAQNGYFNAKVSEIAKATGVADGTIYLYSDGKEDLPITIFREHTRNYLQSLERDLCTISRIRIGETDALATAP